MSLGEAFVEVRADLRPFGRDLRRSVRPMVEAFERELNNAVGRSMLAHSEDDGRRIGDRVSRGIKKSLTHQLKDRNAFIVIASSLAGALDDGISALPTEVKAGIVLGIIAALPLIGGALTGAIAAAVGVGVAGMGILLAAQFEQVQTAAVEFGRRVREDLVTSAAAFVPAILDAFNMIEVRVRRLRPLLEQIFNVSAGFLEPLVEGGLNAIQEIVESTFASLDNLKPFVDELGSAFQFLGDAIGDAIEILVNTGEDGQAALRDLIALISAAIVATASMLAFFTHLWGIIRKVTVAVAELAGPFSIIAVALAKVIRLIDERSNRNKSFINTNTEAANSFDGLIAATTGETDALKDYAKALDNASESAKTNLDLNLDWEESLDRITEALKENGKTLDIHTDKGRANIKEFLNGLKVAEERALLRVQRGEQTAAQAAAQYSAETEQLRRMAVQAGLSEQAFNDLFTEIILTSELRISAQEMGITGLNDELGNGAALAKELAATLNLIKTLSVNIGRGALAGVKGFADGGMHFLPDVVRVAEDGPEVTLPLTKPSRAAALLRQSGLSSLLGSGPSQVLVFVGNEQLDARMVRIVERNNQSQALALNHGGRTF